MPKNKQTGLAQYEVFQPILISLLIILGIIIGYNLAAEKETNLTFSEVDGNSVNGDTDDIIKFIKAKYVDTISDLSLQKLAIDGIMDRLDPHSVYLSAEELQIIDSEMNGSYVGLGIETINVSDTVVVLKVLPNSPAYQAGVKQFDRILAINNERVDKPDFGFNELKSALSGSVNDLKELTILSPDAQEVKQIGVRLDKVPLELVPIKSIINDSIGYVKISKFVKGSYKAFVQALEELGDQYFEHLIIDLRGNQGGYLKETVQIVTQLFREKDQLLVYTEGVNDGKVEYKSTGRVFFNIDRVVVLIDSMSASGSEILAGAIQDWDRGILIGTESYGKGLVQEQYSLAAGGALRLTVARYYTPTGRSIQRRYEGVSASVEEKAEFKTLQKQRIVYSNGGLSPDIYINKENCALPNALMVRDLDDNKLSYLLLNAMNLLDADQLDLLAKDEISIDRISPALYKILKQNNLEGLELTECQMAILHSSVAELWQGESLALKNTYLEDPCIAKAVEVISEKTSMF